MTIFCIFIMACMARSAFFAIGIAQVTAEGRGHNLPGQAEFVPESSAFRFLAAVGDQSVPEVVHLFLALDADEEGDRLVELIFWAAIESVELLPLEFEGRHEVIDGFDLGIGKHRFVEGDSLGDVLSNQRNGVMEVMTDVLVGWVQMGRYPSCFISKAVARARSATGRLTKIVGHHKLRLRGLVRRTNGGKPSASKPPWLLMTTNSIPEIHLHWEVSTVLVALRGSAWRSPPRAPSYALPTAGR